MQISWEVRNRFRLFREERDFLLHAESARGRSILASEQALELQSDGRGWARNTVNRLCIDLTGRVSEPCTRDNVKESYLTPTEHPVTVRLDRRRFRSARPAPGRSTMATAPRQSTLRLRRADQFPRALRPHHHRHRRRLQRTRCAAAHHDRDQGARHLHRRPRRQHRLRRRQSGPADRAVGRGFLFPLLSRDARARNITVRAAPATKAAAPAKRRIRCRYWQRQSALWFNSACHRSLYSYQTRTALALAVQYPHIAVTYLPLACTGATIADGLLGTQRARECLPTKSASACQGTVNAQLAELRDALAAAKRRQPDRKLDLVLLSIGANDINFSGLVADVIVDTPTERALFRRTGVIGSVDDSRAALARDLPQGFARLRDALKPLVGDMSHVVYVSYANPTLADGAPCPGGRAGFDIHPSFNAEPQRLANVSGFVQKRIPAAAEGAGAVPVAACCAAIPPATA